MGWMGPSLPGLPTEPLGLASKAARTQSGDANERSGGLTHGRLGRGFAPRINPIVPLAEVSLERFRVVSPFYEPFFCLCDDLFFLIQRQLSYQDAGA